MTKNRPAGSRRAGARSRGPAAVGIVVALATSVCLHAGPVHAAAPGAPERQSVPVSRTEGDTVAFQNRLNAALQKMLDAVAGPGNTLVTTAAELDFDRVETVTITHTWDPATGALAESLSRRFATDGNGDVRYESTSTVRANALSSLRETRRNAPGRVEKLSIAVVVDATAGQNIDLAQLETLVGVAAGVDPARGDVVVLEAMPLRAAADSPPAAVDAAPSSGRQPVLPAAGFLLLVLLLVLAGVRYRRRGTRMAAERDHRQLVRAALEEQRPIEATATVTSPARGRPRPGGVERQRMIGQAVGDDPERAATVLRGWAGPSDGRR